MTGGEYESGMPNFFVIGASKCGTTSLHTYLELHPEISMSSVKEPMFFCRTSELEQRRFRHFSGDRPAYLDLFDPDAPVRGESSTAYSMYPVWTGVPEAIRAETRDPKFVYLVKDPIERVPSFWVEAMSGRSARNRQGNRLQTLEEKIGDFEEPTNSFTWPGLYMTQIRQYLEVFPRESILVVDGEELRSSRGSVMAEVFRFLGVEPDFTHPGFTEERNRSAAKKVESRSYIRLANSPTLRSLVDRLPGSFREQAVSGIRKALLRPSDKPSIGPALRSRLEDLYRPEVEELREFTGKSFSSWSI